MSSVSIPSSPFSTITMFSEGLSSSIKTWFSLKMKLEKPISANVVFSNLFLILLVYICWKCGKQSKSYKLID